MPSSTPDQSPAIHLDGRPLEIIERRRRILRPSAGPPDLFALQSARRRALPAFRDPQAHRRHAADFLAPWRGARLPAETCAPAAIDLRRTSERARLHQGAQRRDQCEWPCRPALGAERRPFRLLPDASISAACAGCSWRRRFAWAPRPRPSWRSSAPIGTAYRKARRPRLRSRISSRPSSTAG